MAQLAAAPDLGSGSFGSVGSSPSGRTTYKQQQMNKIKYGICWLFARLFFGLGHLVSLTLNITNGLTYRPYNWLMCVSCYFDELPDGRIGLWKEPTDNKLNE